jgi:hypothetical protein
MARFVGFRRKFGGGDRQGKPTFFAGGAWVPALPNLQTSYVKFLCLKFNFVNSSASLSRRKFGGAVGKSNTILTNADYNEAIMVKIPLRAMRRK